VGASKTNKETKPDAGCQKSGANLFVSTVSLQLAVAAFQTAAPRFPIQTFIAVPEAMQTGVDL
jgi:hypothetical protein